MQGRKRVQDSRGGKPLRAKEGQGQEEEEGAE